MGDMRMACLLGQYDRAQSFDVASLGGATEVGSWAKTGQCSWSFIGSAYPAGVHSSTQALRIDVFSKAGSEFAASYDYGYSDDAFARWFPEVDTHVLESRAWILQSPAPSSGALHFLLKGQDEVSQPLAGSALGAGALVPYTLTTNVASGAGFGPRIALHLPPGSGVHSQTTLLVDDVLTTVDGIALHPEWSFEDRAQLLRSQHRTRAGYLRTLVWERYFAYTVPLRFLSDSHAALIEWWWRGQFALLLTLDSSDSESQRIVRIANDSQPIGRRMKPYQDRWQGTVELESLAPGGLVF